MGKKKKPQILYTIFSSSDVFQFFVIQKLGISLMFQLIFQGRDLLH